MTQGQRALIGWGAALVIGLALWALIAPAFAQTFVCRSGDFRVMVRPAREAIALCELAGAGPGHVACTIPAGANTPPTVIMASRESMRASIYTMGFIFDHETQHACGGLPAERVGHPGL